MTKRSDQKDRVAMPPLTFTGGIRCPANICASVVRGG